MPFLSPLFLHLVKDNNDNLFKLLNTLQQISFILHIISLQHVFYQSAMYVNESIR